MDPQMVELRALTRHVQQIFKHNLEQFREDYIEPQGMTEADLLNISQYIALHYLYNNKDYSNPPMELSVDNTKRALSTIFNDWSRDSEVTPPKDEPPPDTLILCGQFKAARQVLELQNNPEASEQAFASLGKPHDGRIMIEFRDKHNLKVVPGRFSVRELSGIDVSWYSRTQQHDAEMMGYCWKYNEDTARYHARLALSRRPGVDKEALRSAEHLLVNQKFVDQQQLASNQFALIIARATIEKFQASA